MLHPLYARALVACGLASACIAGTADAQQWPTRPVRFVVAFPAGGATDIVARILGQKVSDTLGHNVVIDNRPGAGGSIGSDVVAKASPDGYTILMATNSTHAIGPHLYRNLPYDVQRDFVPVIHVASATNIMLVAPTLPAKNVRELIALAKEKPGTLVYSSSGQGTIIHLTTELFQSMAGIKLVHAPYKGTSLSIPDLISGRVHLLIDSIVSGLQHVRSGRLRAFGVTSAQRSSIVPEIPTLAESGLPGYESEVLFGVYAPRGTPAPVVAGINAAIGRVIALPDTKERFLGQAAEVAGGTPAQYAALMKRESDKWAKVIKEAGVRIE